MLAVLGATVVLNAPTWFYSTILQRELEFWRRFQCQLAQSVTYAAVAIGAAVAGAGVWALVAGAGRRDARLRGDPRSPPAPTGSARPSSAAARGDGDPRGPRLPRAVGARLRRAERRLHVGRRLPRIGAARLLLDGVPGRRAPLLGDHRAGREGDLPGLRADAPPGRERDRLVPLGPPPRRPRRLPDRRSCSARPPSPSRHRLRLPLAADGRRPVDPRRSGARSTTSRRASAG